jgi:hypothetical protein
MLFASDLSHGLIREAVRLRTATDVGILDRLAVDNSPECGRFTKDHDPGTVLDPTRMRPSPHERIGQGAQKKRGGRKPLGLSRCIKMYR